jgi:hypothetical protein
LCKLSSFPLILKLVGSFPFISKSEKAFSFKQLESSLTEMASQRAERKSTVSVFYGAEVDKVRSGSLASGPGSFSGKSRFRALVQSAIGNVKVSKGGDDLYFTAPDCIKVRRRMKVDGLLEMSDDRQALYKKCIDPTIVQGFNNRRDVVIMVGGNQGTNKQAFLHGETFEKTADEDGIPAKVHWGMMMHTVDRLLQLAQSTTCEVSVTAARIHHDHVADVLVSLSGVRLTKSDAQKSRHQYAKLLALSQGVTLDIEEGLDGRFSVSDQLHCSLKSLSDFVHVVNCLAAAQAGKFMVKIGGKHGRALPHHYLVSLRIWRRDQAPNYVHFLELGDLDWTGAEEDTEIYRGVLNTVAEINGLLVKGETLKVKSKLRETTLTRILHSNLNLSATDVVFVGVARFAHGMEMLEYMSKMNNSPLEIVLHGPDGEGGDDVDPEMKEHVKSIQEQCESLKDSVKNLLEEKRSLESKIRSGEESISRLQQQCTIVRKLTSMSTASGKDHRVSDSDKSQDARDARMESLTIAQEQKRRLMAMQRDLAELKGEDQRRSESCLQQIRHITDEKNRCSTRTNILKQEYEMLLAQVRSLEKRIALEHKQRQDEMNQQIQDVIERNLREVEAHNGAQRAATQAAVNSSLLREKREAIREAAVTRGLREAASQLSETIAHENEVWQKEHAELERRLEEVTRQRGALEEELFVVKRRHHMQITQLDEEGKELSDYAYRLTKSLVQFEHYNSTEAKRVLTFPKCGVVIYDTTAEHSIPWFTKHCAEMRKWLDERGYPRPAVFVDIMKSKVTLLDTNPLDAAVANANAFKDRCRTRNMPSSSIARPTTGKTKACVATKTVTGPNKPPSDSAPYQGHSQDFVDQMHETLVRRNHDLEIVLKSRQRLAAMQAKRSGSASTLKK